MRVQRTLTDALKTLAAQAAQQAAGETPSQQVLLKLAEHAAIRYALERFERGEVRVNAIRQIFEGMSQEIEQLRRTLSEEGGAGRVTEQPLVDRLNVQFWAHAPRHSKKNVLLSPEAWHVPGRVVRQCVEELVGSGDSETAASVLSNYSSCISAQEMEARRYTAMGLADVADLIAGSGSELMEDVIRRLAGQVRAEMKPEMLGLLGAAYVRLGQEALRRRMFHAVSTSLLCLKDLEDEKKDIAGDLRHRLGFEDRLPEMVEEIVLARNAPEDVMALLRLMPREAVLAMTERFSHCGFREDCDVLLKVARDLGEGAIESLRHSFLKEPGSRAAETLGLLSNLDFDTVEEHLPRRVPTWQPVVQDRAVRFLAGSGAPARGRLLMKILPNLDPLVRTVALDEVGMTDGEGCVESLLKLASGTLPESCTPLHRLKAMEALGRIGAHEAAQLLKQVVEAKQFLRWVHPSELRITALQALKQIEPAWFEAHSESSGLEERELAIAPLPQDPKSTCIRQRRYERLKLARAVAALTTNLRENCRLSIEMLNLGGGLAVCEQHIAPGAVIVLKIHSGMRAFRATAIVRSARSRAIAFEFVDMELDDRAKLRRLLLEFGANTAEGSSANRSRLRMRTLR
jgi:hypothetical protein